MRVCRREGSREAHLIRRVLQNSRWLVAALCALEPQVDVVKPQRSASDTQTVCVANNDALSRLQLKKLRACQIPASDGCIGREGTGALHIKQNSQKSIPVPVKHKRLKLRQPACPQKFMRERKRLGSALGSDRVELQREYWTPKRHTRTATHEPTRHG